VRVIATGIDVGAIAAISPIDPRPLAGWRADAVVIASLGRLAPEKSVEVIVEAFAPLARKHSALRLLLIGGGPSEHVIRERAASLGLAGRVHVTGLLPRHQAHALLRAADLFAFASRTETQGLVLAEALSAGIPVVALDAPGVRDSVDGVVIRTVAGKTAAALLADGLEKLVGDPARRATMAAEASNGAWRFDLPARIVELRALYRELRSDVR
jgi:glycosyltransferase involved in cell wall biosynthesis